MSGLEVPERALTAAMQGFVETTYGQVDINPAHMLVALDRAKPIIVAAELRKLADDPLADHPEIDGWTSGQVSAWLHLRADELDPRAVAP